MKKSVKFGKKISFEVPQLFWQSQSIWQFLNYGSGRQLHAKAFFVQKIDCILLYYSHHEIQDKEYHFHQQGG